MNDWKSTGEKIMEMLCDGKKLKEIQDELKISKYTLEDKFDKIRIKAGLPRKKSIYKVRKADILANIEKWNAHCRRMENIRREYYASLVRF